MRWESARSSISVAPRALALWYVTSLRSGRDPVLESSRLPLLSFLLSRNNNSRAEKRHDHLHVSSSLRRASRGLLSWSRRGVYEWATGCDTQLGKGALIMCQPLSYRMSLRGVLWDHMIDAIVLQCCIIFFSSSARGEVLWVSRDRVVRSRACGSSSICWQR